MDRIDIHVRQHRFQLALRNLHQDPYVCPENKVHILRFLGFCQASNLGVEKQLIYLQKLTVLGRFRKLPFEQAARAKTGLSGRQRFFLSVLLKQILVIHVY